MDDESPQPLRLTPEEVARLEAARATLAAAPREADALEFAIEGDRFVIVQGFPDDVAAAADPHVVSRHQLIIEKLRDLEEALGSRLDNQRAWRRLPRSIRRLLAAADGPVSEMPHRLVELYDHAVSLASFVEQDDAIGEDPRASDDPLDADIRRALGDAIGSLAPWLRSFPTVRQWDGARHDFLARPELYETVRARLSDVRKVLEAARETGALSQEDAARALEPINTAENAAHLGFQAEKAGHRGLATGRRFVTAALCGAAGLFAGAVFSDAATKSLVIQSAGTVVARTIDETFAIIGTMPNDLQTAARELGLRVHEATRAGMLPSLLPSPLPTPPALAQLNRTADGIPLPPELYTVETLIFRKSDVEDISALADAKNLKTLHFSIARVKDISALSNLQKLEELYFQGCPIVSLMPLVGLKKLKSLSIDSTGIIDISPVKFIGTLTALSIDFSPVSDITPLADLVYLTELNLSRTQVADLTPLRGLRNLRNLSLDTTKVSDLTPLRDLANLERLSAWGNDIADISPLAALSKLKRLNLSHTRVADVTPLAGLVHLTELLLMDTPVIDVRPLASLTSLKTLLLPANADPTPLLHLPAFRKRRT